MKNYDWKKYVETTTVCNLVVGQDGWTSKDQKCLKKYLRLLERRTSSHKTSSLFSNLL